MTDSGPDDLEPLLPQLNAHEHARPTAPSPTEAMAIYFVAARLVELQLELVGRGEYDVEELAATRDLLKGTHRLLNEALERAEQSVPARARLQVVPEERPIRPRPRRPKRAS
jgi:hypothetical protein